MDSVGRRTPRQPPRLHEASSQMKRRKVQAQRKFAQGYTPPANPDRNARCQIDLKEDDKKPERKSHTIFSNLSASSLLDIAAYSNIHTHDARVLVERLDDNVGRRVIGTLEEISVKTKKKTKPMSRMELRSRINKAQKGMIKKQTRTTKKNTPKQLQKRIASELIEKKRSQSTPPNHCKSSVMSGFSTDDDTPLNQLRRVSRRFTRLKTILNVSVDNSNPVNGDSTEPLTKDRSNSGSDNASPNTGSEARTCATIARKSPNSKSSNCEPRVILQNCDTLSKTVSKVLIPNSEMLKTVAPTESSSRQYNGNVFASEKTGYTYYGRNRISNWLNANTKKTQNVYTANKTPECNNIAVETPNVNELVEETPNVNDVKEETHNGNDVEEDTHNVHGFEEQTHNVNSVPDETHSVNNISEETHVNAIVSEPRNDNDFAEITEVENEIYEYFKEPEPVPLPGLEQTSLEQNDIRSANPFHQPTELSSNMSSTNARPSLPCPSVQFSTPDTVRTVTQSDVDRMCQSCTNCARMKKLITFFSVPINVADFMKEVNSQQNCLPITQDVYSFVDTEAIIEQPRFRSASNRRQATNNDPITVTQETDSDQTPLGSTPDNSSASPAEGTSHQVYIDLQADGGDKIQVMALNAPKGGKPYLQARVVTKAIMDQIMVDGENRVGSAEKEALINEIIKLIDKAVAKNNNTSNESPNVLPDNVIPSTSSSSHASPNTTSHGMVRRNRIFKTKQNTIITTSVLNSPQDPKPKTGKSLPKKPNANKRSRTPKVSSAIPNKRTRSNKIDSPKVTTSTVTEDMREANAFNRTSMHAAPGDAFSQISSESSKHALKRAKLLDAPVFRPSGSEFENPLAYIQKITPQASKFGLCKIVPPPGFKPKCHIEDEAHFKSTNQLPQKMCSRWCPTTRELIAIRAHLATQKVPFTRPPLIDGIELNLPKLYHIVQRMGGLKNVIEKKKWQRVAEEMNYPRGKQIEHRLDKAYVKYLLPYDTLTNRERQDILAKVDAKWNKRYKRMLERARNPLVKQKALLGEAADVDGEDDDADDEDDGLDGALDEVDECILPGRNMDLKTFKKIAAKIEAMNFPNLKRRPTLAEVEDYYWRVVVLGSEHLCVHTGSLDTSEQGYGFTKNKADPYSKHPWNPKVLSNNPGSMLRSLGPVLSVTVPSLHLGMIFSTSCWHRDPHGLPWIEYQHEGPPKIWYGIPDEQSDRFRRAVEKLCPAFCQNKSIWLASDITMIPPNLLTENEVSLSRTTQNPGEFIVVFPKAYSSSICTGFTVSESVYFAPLSWLDTVMYDFQVVRDSCEPTMFSLEQLLIAIANDERVPPSVLPAVHRALETRLVDESNARHALVTLGLEEEEARHPPQRKNAAWNVRELEECDVCRTTLYLSKVVGLTDKKSAHCLEHAVRLLEAGVSRDGAKLVSYYTEEALRAVLARLTRRLFPDGPSTSSS